MTTAHSIERRKTGCLRLAAACMVHLALSSLLPQDAIARPVRVATYNIEFGTGAVGSDKYNAIRSTLARIDADIVCFQELWPDTFGAWSNMASSLGYSNTAIGANAPFSGGMYLGFASRYPILGTANATSPPGAVELTRYPFRAVVAVPDAQRPLVLWTMHHKSSDANIDKFRRAVEARRAVQNIDAYVAANPDHVEYLFVGDMNEDVRDSQSAQFTNQPSGAPDNYVLGSDIAFPVLYSKFPTDRYAGAGLGLARMTSYWENSSTPITRIVSGRQLDYVFLSPALMNSPLGAPLAETYYSANDLGGGLSKAGSPLAAGTSAAASDHLPIFFDIQMADYSTVIPSAAFATAGEAGGPFSPSSKTYTIRDTNSFSTSWSATADVPWLSINNQNPAVSPLVPIDVVVSLSAGANALAPGTHEGSVAFRNLTTGIEEIRDVVLAVRDHLAVSPEEGFASAGLLGGPFTPTSKVYVVTNKSAVSRAFTATASTNWLTVSPASGTIPARQAVAVAVSINANANPLLGKTYSASVVFSNQASGLVHGRPVTLAISGALCDALDSCDRTWTTGGNSAWYYQTTNTSDAVDAARSGAVTTGQHSWVETTVAGPGQVAFNWRVSSKPTFHPMRFTDNGTTKAFISGGVDWNRRTYEFTSGVHVLRWDMDLSVITSPLGASAGWLDQVAIDNFAVAPTNAWTATGYLEGPFSPASRPYLLTNAGSSSIQWSAAPTAPWLTAVPDYGQLAPGASAVVEVSLNEWVNALPFGSNVAAVVFSNQVSGLSVSRPVVAVADGMVCQAVERCDLTWTTGGNKPWFYQTGVTTDGVDAAQSGSLGLNQQSWMETTVTGPVRLGFTWKLSAYSAHSMRFTDNGATNLQVSGGVAWTPVSFELTPGTHTLRWSFATASGIILEPNAGYVDRVTLDYLYVSPSNVWQISGPLGGPFAPASTEYVLTNASPDPLPWTAIPDVDWISPTSGIIPPNSVSTISLALNGNADLLPYGASTNGMYVRNAFVAFSNQMSGLVQTRPVVLVILASLCDAVDACDLPWSTGGSTGWSHQATTMFDGVDAAQCGPLTRGQKSWMETSVSGPGIVSFTWRISSRTNVHPAEFFVDDVSKVRISGEVDWSRRSYLLESGEHVLKWVFTNDTAAGLNSNAVWVDRFVWTPTTALGVPIAWYQNYGLSPSGGQTWDDLDSLPAASGVPHWFQYAAGLDPVDPDAIFRMFGITQMPGEPTALQWLGGTNGPSTPYVIQTTTNLDLDAWTPTGSSPRVQGLNVWTNAPPSGVKRYYRVLAPLGP